MVVRLATYIHFGTQILVNCIQKFDSYECCPPCLRGDATIMASFGLMYIGIMLAESMRHPYIPILFRINWLLVCLIFFLKRAMTTKQSVETAFVIRQPLLSSRLVSSQEMDSI